MKKKLILLALAIVCYGHMQAADTGEKGWFANRWDRLKSYIPANIREYTPYQQGSFKTYQPENVASRLASMQYLYGNDVAHDQEQLIKDYRQYLWDKDMRQTRKSVYYAQAEEAARNLNLQKEADKMYGQWKKSGEKCSRVYNLRENLVPNIRQQEAEMLRPRTFYEYQHPNQYILNN